MRAVRYLMARCICVTVYGDHFHAQALQGDDDFFAEFTTAQQHDFGGGGR
jgi:hypothetical protein